MGLNIEKRIKMKKLTIALLLFTLSAFTSWAGDFQKGVGAYNSGDYTTALREFTELAEQGDEAAQYNLGVMYAKGQGVPQDNVYAHMWFNLAAVDGYEDASKNRDIIAERMTTEALSKAQSLARECLKKNYKGC